MQNSMYNAFGEEAARGTKEVSTVGFIPSLSKAIPKFEPDDKVSEEVRGQQTGLGDTTVERLSRKWSHTFEMPFFTEAGTTKSMVGTLLKHLFGTAVGAENAATGQYYWMMYAVPDPFSSSYLGAKGLTLNFNINEGATMKNWPYVGGRVMGMSFDQEAGEKLKVSVDLVGQYKDTTTAELGSAIFPAENLRCDYNNLNAYYGTITRVGTGPDFTDFTFGSATQFTPQKVSIKIATGREDKLVCNGTDYPGLTDCGKFEVDIEITMNWADPASGFSTVDEFNNWVASVSETNFCFHWDTGTIAGTGDNHGLYLDIPRAVRQGGDPDYSDKDPIVTLKYKALLDETTTQYIIGCMLKNTATAL